MPNLCRSEKDIDNKSYSYSGLFYNHGFYTDKKERRNGFQEKGNNMNNSFFSSESRKVDSGSSQEKKGVFLFSKSEKESSHQRRLLGCFFFQDRVGQFLNFLRLRVGFFLFEPFSFVGKKFPYWSSLCRTKWMGFLSDVFACSQFYKNSKKSRGFLDFSDQRRVLFKIRKD